MTTEELKAKYGLITTFTIVIGAVIGVGIFLRAPQMSLLAGGNVTAILTAWVISAVMVIPITISIAELASFNTKSGGLQTFGESTWGPRTGFAMGWTQAFFYIPTNVTIMVYLSADYTFKALNISNPTVSAIIFLALFYVVALFLLNLLSSLLAGIFQVASTFIKIIPIILIAILGILYTGTHVDVIGSNTDLLNQFHINEKLSFFNQIAAVLPVSLFSLEGWIFVCVISKEIKNPTRNIPVSIVGGIVLVIILYILFTLGSFYVVNPLSLATNSISTADISRILMGNTIGGIVNIFILVSALGVANANVMALIRAPYSLSKGRTFFGSNFLEKINKKTNIPVNSGLLSIVIVILYLMVPYFLNITDNGNIYNMLIDTCVLVFFIYYALLCVGAVKLRFTQPNVTRKFKAPFIGLLSILALIGCIYAVYGLIVAYQSMLIKVFIMMLCALSGFFMFSFTNNNTK